MNSGADLHQVDRSDDRGCYHCAEPVPAGSQWHVAFDGEDRPVCCIGCQAVMSAIIASGLDRYYRCRSQPARAGVIPPAIQAALNRTDPDGTGDSETADMSDAAAWSDFAIYDTPEIAAQYLQTPLSPGRNSYSARQSDHSGHASAETTDTDIVEVNVCVEGLTCGACVWLLEHRLSQVQGVISASFNFSHSRGHIVFSPSEVALSQLLYRIAEIGYDATPYDVKTRELQLAKTARLYCQRLFIAGIAMMQVMMYALPGYLSETNAIEPSHIQLLHWASLLLTTPVLLFSAKPFFTSALRDLRHRSVGMDVPVSLAILLAFGASVVATVSGKGVVYFDSVAMFVFLLTGARYVEWSLRSRAIRAMDDITAHAPETAVVVSDSEGVRTRERIPAVRLSLGDCIEVADGERIPADAVVLQGRGSVDNALLTGESLPVPVSAGDVVVGGALVAGAPLVLRVVQAQSDSSLSVITRLMNRGMAEKSGFVTRTDRIAGLFIPVVLGLVMMTYIAWYFIDPARATVIAVAVLVVSCPCALSLAMPAALAATTGRLLNRRLLITRGHALDTAARVTDLVLDKTGTLTTGRPELVSVECLNPSVSVQAGIGNDLASLLQFASVLEAGSHQPFAKALVAAAAISDRDCTHGIIPDSIEHVTGQGVRAETLNGYQFRLGSASWCDVESLDTVHNTIGSHRACSEIYLCLRPANTDSEHFVPLARFLLRDAVRPEAKAFINTMKEEGVALHLLSGDKEAVVQEVAKTVGITRWCSGAIPSEKARYVQSLQRDGRVVLMVGDGINDAPVLACASVSMAMANASALAQTAADVIALQPGLHGVQLLLRSARQTQRVIFQNLGWALAYNACAVPAAMLGLVAPWAAAIGMALSSLWVVLNASRLWRTDVKPAAAPPPELRSPAWSR